MSPEEILSRASRVGVMVHRVERRLVEPTNIPGYAKRSLPYSFDYSYCEILPPGDGYSIFDGMCRYGRHDWLPWENWGKKWCFLDDCRYDLESHQLKEAMYEYESKNRLNQQSR